MTDEPTKSNDLFEALDEAAIAILARAQDGVTVKSDESGGAERISLNEQIKAFEAVAKYAEQRAKSNPPASPPPEKPKGSRFASLRAEFNGDTPRRRNSRAAAPPETAGSA